MQVAIPAVVYAAAGSQVLPILAGAAARDRLTPVRKLIVAWCLTLILGDAAQYFALVAAGQNLWLRVVTTPLSDALLVLAFALWQVRSVPRIGMRVGLAIYIPVWIAYVVYEGPNRPSQMADPLRALILLAVAMLTLVVNSAADAEGVTRRDWFWVSVGVALYVALGAALGPFSSALFGNDPEVVKRAFVLKAWSDILAFTLIAVGMLCPVAPAKPGRSI